MSCALTTRSDASDAMADVAIDRRLEDWLVCYLDDRDLARSSISFGELLETNVSMPLGDRRGRGRTTPRRGRPPLTRHWARIEVHRRHSIVVARLLDRQLIKENVIAEAAEELEDLVRAGNRRLILNCAGVERMSSAIVGVLMRIHRACAAEPGGMLRLCGLRPEVADIFAVSGLENVIAVYPDEGAAMDERSWPARTEPRPLPLSILSALTDAPRTASPPRIAESGDQQSPVGPAHQADDETPDTSVWLIVEEGVPSGPSKGDVIKVSGACFSIGHGRECEFRVPDPEMGRRHAAIERTGDEVWLRDLGSSEATRHNGRSLRNSRTPLRHGDRVQLGPLRLFVVVGSDLVRHSELEDLVASWLTDWTDEALEPSSPLTSAEASNEGFALASETLGDEQPVERVGPLMVQVIQNVLVAAPRIGRLDDDDSVESFRESLFTLLDRDLPRRVVIKLDKVSHVSSRCLGVLLAAHLRLARGGGAIRLCDLHARVYSVLEQFRLPVMMELFSSVEEAVITAWE